MNRLYTIILLLIITLSAQAQKRFYNLTADEVKIDSVLPKTVYSHYLPSNYADSTYSLVLKYPEFIDMSARDVALYKVLTKGKRPGTMPSVDDFITIDRRKACFTATFCPVVYRDGKYKWLVSFMAELVSSPKNGIAAKAKGTLSRSSTASTPSSRYAAHSVLATGKWAKIRVAQSGIHQLTDATIRKAGFSDPSKVKIYGYGGNLVPETLTDSYLREYDDLKEVATCTVGGKRLFYAKGSVSWSSNTEVTRTRNPYSDYGYYFITANDSTPLTCSEEELLSVAAASADNYHSLYEKDEFAWYQGGRNLFDGTPIAVGSKRTYNLSVPEGNSQAKLTVSTTAGAASRVQISLNDSIIGTQNIILYDYDKGNEVVTTFNVSNLKESNAVTIEVLSGSAARLDYISFAFEKPKKSPVLASDAFPAAQYVYNITNQDLHSDEGYDMVIIIPTSQKLLAQAQRLARHHEEKDSLKVRIVPADELYNEFSSGTPDVSAYKRYMKMLYDKAENGAQSPRYLLLFGDCVFDNRMLTAEMQKYSPDDFLLCYESENSFNEVYCFVSDDFCTLLDDNESMKTGDYYRGLPDIAVGRFPCSKAEEAKIMVDKTIAYATQSPSGDWQNTIMFLGDDGNNNIHMKDIDEAANQTIANHPGYYVRKVLWDAYTRVSSSTGHRYPEVTKIIKQQQNDGALIIDYGGHGSEISISHEAVLTLPDFAAFRGKNYSLWVTASCDIMPFDGLKETIGETMVLNDKGGSVAFYGTTRTVLSSYNRLINKAFMKYVLSYDTNGKPLTIGEAQRMAKNELVRNGNDLSVNKLQYALLGDPALSLALPTLSVAVDSINGKAITANDMPRIKAGELVRVAGHIVRNGEKMKDFNGTMSAIVRDTEEQIVCKLNDESKDGADEPLKYTDRTKILFHGSNKVKDGDFSFVFAVPMDINYAEGNGLMNFYAIDDDKTVSAHGAFDQFEVNGSVTMENDSIGPSVFCYLNSPDFTYGGVVNSTPFFVAEISDKNGINASGSGIGHDMQLIIDGDINKTYILNDYFTFDFGSYTSGQTYYAIPQLEPGEHTLKFRAWDILNNPTTSTLKFVVKNGLKPNISNISVTPNPASESVTFIINHDRTGTESNFEIDVMDASGRLLWTKQESGTASDNSYTVTWNLTLDNGLPLQTGVYLYRIRMSSGGSSWVSKAKKMIVVRQ